MPEQTQTRPECPDEAAHAAFFISGSYRIRIFGGEKKDYCDKVNKIKTLLQDTKQKYDRNRRFLPGEELLVFTRFSVYGDGNFSVLTDLKIPDDTCLPGLLKNQ